MLGLLLTNMGFSQVADQNTTLSGNVIQTVNKKDLSNVIGSPYYNDSFLQGTVFLNKDDYSNAMLRYNIFQDCFEMEASGKVNILSKDPSVSYQIGSEEFKRFGFDDREKYMVIIYDSKKVSLLHNFYKTYQAPKEATNSYDSDRPAKYSDKDMYCISFDGKKAVELEKSNKKVIAQFPKHNKELKAYTSENKLKLRKIEDVITLSKYYNTL